ncbi:DUF3397 family protein [Planococcus sp. YIM B11945]|uniref:DUF3397 family protein n=1 Tax=Planococcus sp. YIM B11945 TaxID=3435410 RepID=UPI003D7CDD83
MIILQTIGTVFIFAPFIAFVLVFLVARKLLGRKAFELAADLTTLLLFFSVPILIHTLWNVETGAIVCFIALLLAIVFLIMEWKRSKELLILGFFRKMWRMYFLLLSFSTVSIWMVGLVYTVSRFLMSSY